MDISAGIGHQRGAWRGIAGRLRLISIVFAALVAVLAGGLVLQARESQRAAERVATEIVAPLEDARTLVAAIDALNVRLLGVMSNIYSSPGSVERVRQLAVALAEAHKALAARSIAVDAAQAAAADKAAMGIPKLVEQLVPLLQGERRIGPVYEEDWIDIQTPLARYAAAVSKTVDDTAAETIARDQAAAQRLLVLALVAGAIGLLIAA